MKGRQYDPYYGLSVIMDKINKIPNLKWTFPGEFEDKTSRSPA